MILSFAQEVENLQQPAGGWRAASWALFGMETSEVNKRQRRNRVLIYLISTALFDSLIWVSWASQKFFFPRMIRIIQSKLILRPHSDQIRGCGFWCGRTHLGEYHHLVHELIQLQFFFLLPVCAVSWQHHVVWQQHNRNSDWQVMWPVTAASCRVTILQLLSLMFCCRADAFFPPETLAARSDKS